MCVTVQISVICIIYCCVCVCISGVIRASAWRLEHGHTAWMEAGGRGRSGASAAGHAVVEFPRPCDTVTVQRK